MAEIVKQRRLTNPGKKRKLSPLQKLFFGSKRQRTAVANSGSLSRTFKKAMKATGHPLGTAQNRYKRLRSSRRYAKRTRNAGMGYRGSTPSPSRKMSATKRVYFKRRANSGSTSRTRKQLYRAVKSGRRLSTADIAKAAYRGSESQFREYKRRYRKNVGSIVTVWPNPGRNRKRRFGSVSKLVTGLFKGKYKRKKKANRGKKVIVINRGVRTMARRRRRVSRRNPTRRVARRRRRRNPVYRGTMRRVGRKYGRAAKGAYVYTSNPGRRRRRRNVSRRRYSRRRNPGMLTGTAGRVLGVVGGVALTKVLSGFLPAQFSSGILGYVGVGAIAVLQGKLVGKFSKSPALGNDMLIGGLAYLAAKVLNDFFPQIGAYTGISGMGLIGGSNFYVPQVNMNGSMGSFMVPGAVTGAIAGAIPVQTARGVGSMRRTGRLM